MHGAIPPLPQYVFMTWYLIKYRDISYHCLEQAAVDLILERRRRMVMMIALLQG
jgi:hypothetical protein